MLKSNRKTLRKKTTEVEAKTLDLRLKKIENQRQSEVKIDTP